ncbi:MAG: asparagine synthase (glutamine-hydrolyzing), partial [Actinobacteria bacterium]|nr:asparagine synthase (glutamine-hydrolyzing) [Actinomycetota bacterium]
PDAGALRAMATTMAHRGPDAEAVWHDDVAGLAFRRLAIIDLHERSNQPMHHGALHVVFNGEIYNYIELRDELRGLGHEFVTAGDTEVLLHAWAQWGEGALDRVNGMFAFAIWDGVRRRLTLATDPFAEKPLFYAPAADGRLLFGSDVRALRAADAGLGEPDLGALRRFVALGTMPVLPATFYARVRRLPGAHLARWEGGALSVRRYWEPRRVAVPQAPADAAARLRELVVDSVRLRLRSDVPVGTSLSGGVDSSVVAAACAQLSAAGERHAFTATFPGFARDEWRYAQDAARAAGVARHHAVAPARDELLADLETFTRDQEEPFPTTSIYAQWRVMAAAREAGVVVMLDGQGADELLAGYRTTASLAALCAGPRALARAVAGDPRSAFDGLATGFAADHVPHAVAARYRRRQASPYVLPALARDAAAAADLPLPSWTPRGGPLRRELLRETFMTILPDLLRFADRNSMAHSLEVRLPFLDRRIAEFALSLPARLLVRDGVSKRVLRDAFADIVPASVLARRDKVGYETPEAKWLGAPEARRRLGEVLLDGRARSRGWFDAAALEHDVATGWRDVGAMWRALNGELWLAELAGARSLVAA